MEMLVFIFWKSTLIFFDPLKEVDHAFNDPSYKSWAAYNNNGVIYTKTI